MKPHYISIVSYPCYGYVVLQFQTDASSHSDTNANSGGVDGRTSGQAQRPAAVLPVYMTQDRLTLAVLTLLLGGWLAFALTYPAVSVCVYLLLRCVFKSPGFVFKDIKNKWWQTACLCGRVLGEISILFFMTCNCYFSIHITMRDQQIHLPHCSLSTLCKP